VQRIETTEAFILERTGVETRHHATSSQSLSDLIIPAATQAVSNAGLTMQDIDCLIINTLSPDYHDPSQACFIQAKLALNEIPAFDIRAQCSGFLYGLRIADSFIRSNSYQRILLICAEMLSKRMDCSNDGRNLAILLGDGAGAVVIESTDNQERGLIDIELAANGEHFYSLYTQAPGSSNARFITKEDVEKGKTEFRMQGKKVFDHAVAMLVASANALLAKHQLKLDDIDSVIVHQPNLRILDAVRLALAIPEEKLPINVTHFGNMASASLAVTYAHCVAEQRIKQGDLVLLLAYGAGATWGAALYRA
jgi:3-oxoacyl-(acyl-carrier-protein) synthase III